MDRRDTYHGQVVTEGDVDEWLDDVENAEHDLSDNAGLSQALITDTPDPAVYGGIVKGLAVTGTPGEEYVTVALGEARDNSGQHIELEAPATVKLSKTGETTIADGTLAEGDAAAIAGGSCPVGEYICISIFIEFAQLLADAKTDAGGATVYYDRTESFRFYLAVGSASYVHAVPLAGTVTRAALANGMVLLADVIAYNDAGTMKVAAVMSTTPDWISTYDPPGNYANITGRRADWLTLQTTDEFVTTEATEDFLRVMTPRQALYDLGRKVRSEAFISHRVLGVPALFSMRKQFGHPCRPHAFFDDMEYNSNAYSNATGEFGPRWKAVISGGGGLGVAPIGNRIDPYGSYAALYTNNAAGQGVRLYTPFAWTLGASPWVVAMFRIWLSHSTANQQQFVGLAQTLGVNTNQVGFKLASGTGIDKCIAYTYDSLSAATTVDMGAMAASTWYTLRIAVLDNAGAYFQMNNGAWTRLATTGTFGGVACCAFAQSHTVDGTVRYLRLDQAFAADGELSADMA